MNTIQQRIDEVRNDREHGSRWLVRQAIGILYDVAREQSVAQEEQLRELLTVGRVLAQARPAMAALSGAVGRILTVRGGPPAVALAAQHLLQEYDNATARIATHAKPYLLGCLMTCSISGTVLEVLYALKPQITQMIVLEGRPRYEGRETARVLSSQGFAVTLITDAQADIFMPRCQAVVVGADSILANGDVLNKAGTALLAHAAHWHGVPLYVLCETLKIAPHDWPHEREQALALLEEKEPEEVLQEPLPGVAVRNFYFDHTPHTLINAIVSEQGVVVLPVIMSIADSVKENAHVLFGG